MKNAIQTLQDLHSIDIWDHVPRDVRDLDLDTFDCIIAIGDSAYAVLSNYPDLRTEVRPWQVSDPFGMPVYVYKRCAQELEERIWDLSKVFLVQSGDVEVG